jgi:hypothetical protein
MAAASISSFGLFSMLLLGMPLNLPLSLPPLPPDPVLQAMAPADCLWYVGLAGVERANIIICDRNRAQLNNIAGWLPAGVRLAAASWEWSGDQTQRHRRPDQEP